MRLRTKLILAFLLLAVVPLAGVTLYSYYSSQRALRRTVEADSDALARELQRRMASASDDITHRIGRLREMPMQMFMTRQQGGQDDPQRKAMVDQVMSMMGELAPFIDSLEIMPMPPKPPETPPPAGPRRRPAEPPPPPPLRAFRLEIPGPAAPEALEQFQRQALRLAEEAQKKASALRDAAHKQSLPDQHRIQVLDSRSRELELRLGRQFGTELLQDGQVVGKIQAQIRTRQLLRSVLSRSRRTQGEIPFALDPAGKLHTPDLADLAKLEPLQLETSGESTRQGSAERSWVVATHKDTTSGLTFGIVHPIGEQLHEIRRAAVKNLAYGLGMVGLALIGVIPLSGRMTRNLTVLTRGAEQLARGDLSTRVDISARDEIGKLAQAFNRMAEDLTRHERTIVEQERIRRELELCRKIQEELLPHEVFRSGIVEARGVSIPAREVGGDFFNYFPLPSGDVALLIGDVSGKGLPAALMMANIQATLQARLPLEADLAQLARELDRQIGASTPAEVYLTLFMGVLDMKNCTLRYVNAGHNPQFALHAEGTVERLESTGRPLGLLPDGDYEERTAVVRSGDSLFFYTDGLSEAEDEAGEEFGTDRLERVLVQDNAGVDGLLARVETAVRNHRGGREAADDATMMLVRIGA